MFFLELLFVVDVLVITDIILTAYGIQGVYFLYHALHNLFMGFITWKHVTNTIAMENEEERLSSSVYYLVYSIHLYHIIRYIRKISFDEMIHHILCLGIAIPLVNYNFDNRNLLGFSFFATTGWPTVFYYINLFLYKNHSMSKLTMLRYNFFMNTFLRSPFIILNAGFLLQHMIKEELQFHQVGMSIILLFILVWNALYFQYRITEKYFEKKFLYSRIIP